MTDTRSHDWEIIRRASLSSNPEERRQASIAAQRLNRESGKVKSMREALIRAHRDGNKSEIKDIHDFVERHKEDYKNYW